MGNSHHHHHHHGNSKNILIAFGLNFSFAIIELFGGMYTNSVAIISDALHDFGDAMALLFSYIAEKISRKKADQKFTFGYRRFSIISALINALILLGGSIYVITEAIERLKQPQELDPLGMIALAILGIAVNSFAAYRLSKDEGLNSKMVMWHLLEDLLGWVAVLVVSIVLLFKPWYILDSILSIMISLIILKGVLKNFYKIVMVLLQRFPDNLAIEEISKKIMNINNVKDIHAIKAWSLDDEHHYLRFHVALPAELTIFDSDQIKREIKNILKNYHIAYSTIEFEAYSSEDNLSHCMAEEHE